MSPNLDRALTRVVNIAVFIAIMHVVLTCWVAVHDLSAIQRVLTPEREAWLFDCRSLVRGHEAECGRMVLPPVPDGGDKAQ